MNRDLPQNIFRFYNPKNEFNPYCVLPSRTFEEYSIHDIVNAAFFWEKEKSFSEKWSTWECSDWCFALSEINKDRDFIHLLSDSEYEYPSPSHAKQLLLWWIELSLLHEKSISERAYENNPLAEHYFSTDNLVLTDSCLYFQHTNHSSLSENKLLFWEYEHIWVVHTSQNRSYLIENMIEFQEKLRFDVIPLSMQALLLNRYAHWNEETDGFQDWYKLYLSE